MGRKDISELRPFISVLLIIVTLFFVVFLKMEVRSQGYTVWKKVRMYEKMRDNHRLKFIEYVRLKNPFQLSERFEDRAKDEGRGMVQVIQMSGEYVAVKQ